MATLIEGISSAVRGTFCSALKNGSNFAGLFPSGLGSQTISETLNSAAGFVCNAPFDGGGSSGGGGVGGDWDINLGSSPPFSGGQCEGAQYGASFTFSGTGNSGQPINISNSVAANILSPRITGVVDDVTLEFSGTNQNFKTPRFRVFHALGSTVINITGNTVAISPLPTWTFALTGDNSCGDPLPEIQPEDELDDTIDVDYDDDDGNPISLPNLPIKFFPPCINLDGIRVPFEIDTPFGKVCGKIGLRPDFPRVLEPDIDFDLCPSQRSDLAPAISEDIKNYFEVGGEIGGGGTPFPVTSYGSEPNIIADIEKPILGIFVRVEQDTVKGKATQIFNTDSNSNAPDLLIPRLGQARFYLAIESENFMDTEWSQPIDIKQPISFIPCPWEFGALAVDVQAENGYKIVYAPAFRKSCCDSCKGQSVEDILDNIDRCRID